MGCCADTGKMANKLFSLGSNCFVRIGVFKNAPSICLFKMNPGAYSDEDLQSLFDSHTLNETKARCFLKLDQFQKVLENARRITMLLRRSDLNNEEEVNKLLGFPGIKLTDTAHSLIYPQIFLSVGEFLGRTYISIRQWLPTDENKNILSPLMEPSLDLDKHRYWLPSRFYGISITESTWYNLVLNGQRILDGALAIHKSLCNDASDKLIDEDNSELEIFETLNKLESFITNYKENTLNRQDTLPLLES